MVLAVLGRWGNDVAVRLPNEIVEAVRFSEGERVEIGVSDGEVVLKRAAPRQMLEEMFAGKTADAWRSGTRAPTTGGRMSAARSFRSDG